MEDLLVAVTWPGLVLAVLAGFAFGYLVIGRMSLNPRWRNPNSPRPSVVGWLTGVTSAWWAYSVIVSQVVAAIWAGDPLWVRILSRWFMWVASSVGLGLGIYVALRRHRTH